MVCLFRRPEKIIQFSTNIMNDKLKIGIWLNCRPHLGGTFQYVLLTLIALAKISKNNPDKYDLYCFSPIKEWEQITEENLREFNYHFAFINKHLVHLGFSWLLRKKNIGLDIWRNINRFSPFAYGKIYKLNIDLMVCPSQDGLAYELKIPTISTIHDLMHRYEPHFPENNLKKEVKRRERHYSLMCRFSDTILVDSQIGKRHVEESYGEILNSNITVLPYLPPPYILSHKQSQDYTYIKKKYDLYDNYLFYPAQFWMHKNHLRLIEAINLLKEKGLNVNAVFVGSVKNNYQQIIDLVNKLDLNNQIKVLNYVSNEDIIGLYKNALALIMPTFYGPTNIPTLEAIYLGIPVLCSGIYAMPEQVGDAGLFFDPKSVEDIANQIYSIWTDENKRNELIKNGRKYRANMTIENYAENWKKIIECSIN